MHIDRSTGRLSTGLLVTGRPYLAFTTLTFRSIARRAPLMPHLEMLHLVGHVALLVGAEGSTVTTPHRHHKLPRRLGRHWVEWDDAQGDQFTLGGHSCDVVYSLTFKLRRSFRWSTRCAKLTLPTAVASFFQARLVAVSRSSKALPLNATSNVAATLDGSSPANRSSSLSVKVIDSVICVTFAKVVTFVNYILQNRSLLQKSTPPMTGMTGGF